MSWPKAVRLTVWWLGVVLGTIGFLLGSIGVMGILMTSYIKGVVWLVIGIIVLVAGYYTSRASRYRKLTPTP